MWELCPIKIAYDEQAPFLGKFVVTAVMYAQLFAMVFLLALVVAFAWKIVA